MMNLAMCFNPQSLAQRVPMHPPCPGDANSRPRYAFKPWVFAISCLAGLLAAPQLSSSPCVDVALVLAVDASASVTDEEFAFQQQGIAAAFRDPEVLQAVRRTGRVAVAAIFWGSEGLPRPQTDWVLLDSPTNVEDFAHRIERLPRNVTGVTALGAALQESFKKLAELETCALRRVINVSGDGKDTLAYRGQRKSLTPLQAKELATAARIEINALAISSEEKDLAQYYARNVITGPGAFVMEVSSYAEIGDALRRKLIREIGPRLLSDGQTPVAGAEALN
jgi:hypothetical protein